MNRITMFLTDHEVAELDAIVAATGLKFAEVVRRILDKGLEESEPSRWGKRRLVSEKVEAGQS
jgi:hypothetical protein